MGLLRRMLRVKAPLIAYSFHFDVDPSASKQRLIAQMARGIDRFVVYSRAEIDHYHRIFGIPGDRIEMTYWGIRAPEPLADPEPVVEGDYLCTIGGSARDYRTFLAAAALVPEIPIVAVVRPQSLEGLEVPPNVRVYVDLPYDRMANVLVHSRGTVIPLTPPARSGHSVLVLALHHAKAAIISDIPGVRDYVRDGRNALACPPSDPEAMASAMRRLWDDPQLGRSLGDEGLRFAREHCTEEAVVSHFLACLGRLGLGD
jgi:glycosyltransferase involved in cell wall biosynthesis